jgi:hypothetical protein
MSLRSLVAINTLRKAVEYGNSECGAVSGLVHLLESDVISDDFDSFAASQGLLVVSAVFTDV